MLAFAMAASIAVGAQETPTSLHLLCGGAGVDTRIETGSASIYGKRGWAEATVYGRKADNFEDELEIQIDGNTGKARLPRRIVPKVHGGNNGWFEIKQLSVDANAITGKIAMNFVNAPYLRINRVSGSVSVDGRDGAFSGQCKNYSPQTVQRAF